PEPDANRNAETDIDDQLHQKILANTFSGVVERSRRSVDIARTDELDEAIAQILAAHQHEDDDNDDDANRSKRLDERACESLEQAQRVGWRILDLHGNRLVRI